jgi:predicted SPOUT superfamily RNA methylase MTH1
MHPDLKFAGLLSPLDAPHHVRADEWSAYREGVVVNRPASQPARNGDNGSYVYIGTKKEVRVCTEQYLHILQCFSMHTQAWLGFLSLILQLLCRT